MNAITPGNADGTGLSPTDDDRSLDAHCSRESQVRRRPAALGFAAFAFAVGIAGCRAPQEQPPAEAPALPQVEVIVPPGVSRLPVFSPAVRVGNLIFLSGAIGVTPGTLELVEGGVRPETRQTLENLRTVLQAAGADLDDAVKCTVFLADIADYAAMNEVYGEFFPENPPARSTVAGSGLALGARVEIECIAAVSETRAEAGT